MKKFVLTLAVGVLFSLPAIALAEKLVFVTSEFPPYVLMENGQLTGIHVEVIREICKRSGIEPDIQAVPWKRALKEVSEGRAACIFSPKKTEERETFLYFPSDAFDAEKTVLLALKGSDIKASGLDDLKGKNIGMVRGYSYGEKFDNNADIEKTECDNDAQMIKMIDKKRFPLIIGEEGNLKLLAKKQGVQLETVCVLEAIPNYITFSKALGERGMALTEKFSETLKLLEHEGVIEKIRSKYQ